MPTMLQAAGVEVPAVVQGESLLGLMKAAAGDGRRTCGATVRHTRSRLSACVWMERTAIAAHGKYLYVQAPRRELYDEAADPKSEHNLATEMKAVADTVGDRLETFRQKTSSKREAPRMSEDPRRRRSWPRWDTHVDHRSEGRKQWQEADPKDNIEAIKGCGGSAS